MRIAEINQWLNSSRPFAIGVELYLKHEHLKPSPGAAIIIKGSESSLSRSVLSRELEEIFNLGTPRNDHNPQPSAPPPHPPQAVRQSFRYSADVQAAMPPRLQAIEALVKKLYGQMDVLKGRMIAEYYDEEDQLIKNPNTDKGGALALKILKIDQRIKESYQILDDWVENGTIESQADAEEVEFLRDSLEAAIRLNYYVKKNEGRLKKGEKLSNPEKLSEAQKQLQSINEYLIKHGRRPIS